jgi:hypothetical protein
MFLVNFIPGKVRFIVFEAYVMDPEKLRKMIQSDLKKMLFRYEGVKVVGEASRGVRKRGTV